MRRMTMNSWGPEGLLVASVVLAALPIVVVTGTCYLKFSIVLGLLRSGFGTQQTPGNALIFGLATSLSLVVMQPVLSDTATRLAQTRPSDIGKLRLSDLSTTGRHLAGPWKRFMLSHTGVRELAFFEELSADEAATPFIGPSEPSLAIAVGAFVLSEVKTGFLTGLLLLLPFFVIDVVVANILVGMGLTMMSPITVSLPLKVLLFVTTDGWLLLANTLARTYQ